MRKMAVQADDVLEIPVDIELRARQKSERRYFYVKVFTQYDLENLFLSLNKPASRILAYILPRMRVAESNRVEFSVKKACEKLEMSSKVVYAGLAALKAADIVVKDGPKRLFVSPYIFFSGDSNQIARVRMEWLRLRNESLIEATFPETTKELPNAKE